eukprot:TRINITY_DN1142_c0_g1_i1.p3 TRINITY_DN1142_c0_g1~~TRINITY_DN1142_c0_g1_i1.p3  ORF type:complete len:57 (+),score=0.81 TRINITY_DN1142_c0_g1_i1:285-455(+)
MKLYKKRGVKRCVPKSSNDQWGFVFVVKKECVVDKGWSDSICCSKTGVSGSKNLEC